MAFARLFRLGLRRVAKLLPELYDPPTEALPDRMRAAREHLLVGDHHEAERAVLVSLRAVIALSQVRGDFLVERQLFRIEGDTHGTCVAACEAADLGLAVADQRPSERMLLDHKIHNPRAFTVVRKQRQRPVRGET